MRAVIFVLITFLLISCVPKQPEKERLQKEPEIIVSRDEALRGLPCFGCHSYEKFTTIEKGMFSHQQHIDSGYHCNQCHDVKGHKHIIINRDVCNSCHNLKKITLKKTLLPSNFDHESHSSLFGCKECHPNLFAMKVGSSTITMNDIYKGEYCGACHNGKKAFSSSECSKCHNIKGFEKDLTYKVEGIGNVIFSHKFHTTAFGCDSCHPKLFAMKKTQGRMKMDDMYNGKYCGACHNGNIASPASDCQKCHR
jgi:c(7)-type cytochrome triheme protein